MLKFCNRCFVDKLVDQFEKNRSVCKECIKLSKKEKMKEVDHKLLMLEIPKPTSCVKCGKGQDEVEFKWRHDLIKGGWRSTCNKCIGSKKYYEKYRNKKLEENPDEFRKHNAIVHREWMKKNPDANKTYKRKISANSEKRFCGILTYAKQKDIFVEMNDKEKLIEMLNQPCEYCGFLPDEGEPLNGLDRIDSNGNYEVKNVVACCGTCNYMKACKTTDEFIQNVRDIVTHLNLQLSDNVNVSRKTLNVFSTRHEKSTKFIEDTLSLDHKILMWTSPCYLCGRSPAYGIDREDSDISYTIENSRPCCSDCNYMKKNIPIDDFKQHIIHIHQHTEYHCLKCIHDVPLKANIKKPRQPVSVILNNITLVFPSTTKTCEILNLKLTYLKKALNKEVQHECLFKYASSKDYRVHRVSQEDALTVINKFYKKHL